VFYLSIKINFLQLLTIVLAPLILLPRFFFFNSFSIAQNPIPNELQIAGSLAITAIP
jgi:hypothetical protein